MGDTNEKSNFPLLYRDFKGDITPGMLNDAYGHAGRSFDTQAEAGAFINNLKPHQTANLTRLIRYNSSDYTYLPEGRPVLKKNAIPITVGWLVTLAT